jgi:GNAT superfamily N-acetyltransferase
VSIPPAQQHGVVAAESPRVRLLPGQAGSAAATQLLAAYYQELAVRFPDGFDVAQTVSAQPHELTPPHGDFLIVEHADSGEKLGCGAVKRLSDGVFEIKRMWISPGYRGHGLGRILLTGLEQRAEAMGAREIRLDTSARLSEALALYRSAGYTETAPYNDNPYAAHWFAKRL